MERAVSYIGATYLTNSASNYPKRNQVSVNLKIDVIAIVLLYHSQRLVIIAIESDPELSVTI